MSVAMTVNPQDVTPRMKLEVDGRAFVNNEGYDGMFYAISSLDDGSLQTDAFAQASEDGYQPDDDAPWERFVFRSQPMRIVRREVLS